MSIGEKIPQDSAHGSVNAIPQPVEVRPGDVAIMNVYGSDASGLPDHASVAVAEHYLADRLIEDPEIRRTVVRRGFSVPYPARVPGPDTIVEVSHATNEWRISPRVAASITLGSAAILNVLPATQTAIGLGEQASHAVYRYFYPLQDTVKTFSIPAYDNEITVEIPSPNKVGAAEVRHQAVTEFSDLIHDAEQNGALIRSIVVEGNSSDEYRSDPNITVIDPENTKLEIERVTITADALQQIMGKNIPVAIERTHKENVLTAEERDAVLAKAQAAGYATISEAIDAVDAGQDVQPELATEINTLFISKRATIMRATVARPGTEIKSEVHTQEQDNPPTMPDVNWIPLFVPMVPWRKREKVSELRGTKRWAKKTKEFFLKPKIIEEDLNNAWVRLRPEAIQEDQTLVENPWAYTRKYEALLREGRIKDVMRADFQIPGKDEQELTDKSLRIMFVDHSPAAETVEAFTKLVNQFAHMQDGALADKISGIFVYPSSNAGKEHAKPEKIGLGVDKQYDASTLGVCTPLLELVEMHMDDTLNSAELLEAFAGHRGPLWALAHEVAGHGSDIADNKPTVEPVRARGIDGAHIITGNMWADRMKQLRGRLRSIVEQREAKLPIQYDISYTLLDANDQPVALTERVVEGDPRLALAQQVTIVGVEPTHYAGSNTAESYAETAAAVTTGLVVPFSEIKSEVPELKTKSGATIARHTNGYRPATNAQTVFTNTVGAKEGSYPATFANPIQAAVVVVKPEDDPLMRQHLIRAREQQFATPEGMVAILTKVVR